MSEHDPLYPAHASRPVEQLLIPGPTAWGTGEEMVQRLFEQLKAAAKLPRLDPRRAA